MHRSPRSPLRRYLITGALLAALAIAMVWNTKFLTPAEVEALSPEQFDPATTAEEILGQVQSEHLEDPDDLGEVAQALEDSPDDAAAEFDALTPSEGIEAYPVEVSGTVDEATDENITLAAEGPLADRTVVIPLGNAIDGNLVRDVSGFKFGDAPGQTEYQQVGSELSTLLRATAQEAVGDDPTALSGEDVTVRGLLRQVTSDGDGGERPLIIQPLEVEVGQ